VEGREERPGSDLVSPARELLKTARYAESVEGLETERLQDEEIEGALEEACFAGHYISYRMSICIVPHLLSTVNRKVFTDIWISCVGTQQQVNSGLANTWRTSYL
jgi:hypothetical protein